MAAREFAEIWGEQMHAARHLRMLTGALGAAVVLLLVVLVRVSWAPPPKPIIVRVDEVGRAEAVAYAAMEAHADPRDPTTGYFLHRFIVDHYGRREGSVQEYWTRSLRFLTPPIADAAFGSQSDDIALVAAGLSSEELWVENVQVRILPQPDEPHSASATFDLIRQRAGQEIARESWSVSMQFRFLTEIPAELVIWNPMGIVISFLQGDRIVSSGE